jgi:hypothetical protein
MKLNIELRYALMIAILLFIWVSLEYIFGLHDQYIAYHPVISNFAVSIPVIGTVLAIRSKKVNTWEGEMSYWQGFLSGLLVSSYAAVFWVIGLFIFFTFVNPHFFDEMIKFSVSRAENLGLDTTDAVIHARHFFNMPSYLLQSFVGVFIIGAITTLVASFVLKSKISKQASPGIGEA